MSLLNFYMKKSLNTGQPLETMEAVTEILRAALEEAKKRMGKERIATFTQGPRGLEEAGVNKGVVIRSGLDGLRNIKVSGQSSTGAIEEALTSILGERQTIPLDAATRNMYVVDLDFAPNGVPTLGIGKIDTATEYLAETTKRAETLGHIRTPEEIVQSVLLPNNAQPFFVIWVAGRTPEEWDGSIFKPRGARGDVLFHVIEMPSPPAVEVEEQRDTVRGSVREVTSS